MMRGNLHLDMNFDIDLTLIRSIGCLETKSFAFILEVLKKVQL